MPTIITPRNGYDCLAVPLASDSADDKNRCATYAVRNVNSGCISPKLKIRTYCDATSLYDTSSLFVNEVNRNKSIVIFTYGTGGYGINCYTDPYITGFAAGFQIYMEIDVLRMFRDGVVSSSVTFQVNIGVNNYSEPCNTAMRDISFGYGWEAEELFRSAADTPNCTTSDICFQTTRWSFTVYDNGTIY